MKIEAFGATDIGLGRLNNEDVWAKMLKEKCFILADGMGGHQAGEVAANEAVVQLLSFIKEEAKHSHTTESWSQLLKQGIEKTNEWIHELASKDKELEGMGTTLCIALVHEKSLIYGHVGDSRIYRVRKGRIAQLTRDHSLKDELIAKGELDESLGRTFPYKNVITRAIGTQKTVTPDIAQTDIEEGDIYFLCSDGLTDPLADEKILSTILSSSSIKEASEDLILEAKKSGGEDNITLVMIKIS